MKSSFVVCAVLATTLLSLTKSDAAQIRHPITGSLPPQGAKCRAHGKEDTYWNPVVNISDPPAPLYLNETLLPITWDFQKGCPMTPPDWEWACCSQAQYNEMVSKEKLLQDVMHGCPACAEALRNLFCWYTCGPWQFYSNKATVLLPEDEQEHPSGEVEVLTTQFSVDYELSQRIWKSCENAGIGIETFKKTYEQNKVMGIFDLIVDFSPSKTLKNGSSYKILGHVILKPTCDQYALGWNTTTAECTHSCSDDEYPKCPTKNPDCAPITAPPSHHGNMTNSPHGGSGSFTLPPNTNNPSGRHSKRPSYPLPKAAVGSLPLQHFIAIILAILLGLVGLIGFMNRDTHEDAELPEKGETAGHDQVTSRSSGTQSLDTFKNESESNNSQRETPATSANNRVARLETVNGGGSDGTNSNGNSKNNRLPRGL